MVYGLTGAAMADTNSIAGSAFSDLKKPATVPTGYSNPVVSLEWQSAVIVTGVVPLRGGATPPHRCPNSLQRNRGGPSALLCRNDDGSNSAVFGGAEQSSSLVMKVTARKASGRRNPALTAGDASWCSKPQPDVPTLARQANASSIVPG